MQGILREFDTANGERVHVFQDLDLVAKSLVLAVAKTCK